MRSNTLFLMVSFLVALLCMACSYSDINGDGDSSDGTDVEEGIDLSSSERDGESEELCRDVFLPKCQGDRCDGNRLVECIMFYYPNDPCPYVDYEESGTDCPEGSSCQGEEGLAQCLLTPPLQLDQDKLIWSNPPMGEASPLTVTVTNSNQVPQTIFHWELRAFDDPAAEALFMVSGLPEEPVELAAGQAMSFDIIFTRPPSGGFPVTAEFFMQSGIPGGIFSDLTLPLEVVYP